MSLTRKCDNCGATIDRPTVIEVTVRVIRCDEDDDQDAVEEKRSDCCDRCLIYGGGLRQLLMELEQHKVTIPVGA